MNVSMEKPHLSYSQINTYLACPLKYKYHYIDRIEPPFVSSALVFGSCIHEAVGAFYQGCLEDTLYLPVRSMTFTVRRGRAIPRSDQYVSSTMTPRNHLPQRQN